MNYAKIQPNRQIETSNHQPPTTNQTDENLRYKIYAQEQVHVYHLSHYLPYTIIPI